MSKMSYRTTRTVVNYLHPLSAANNLPIPMMMTRNVRIAPKILTGQPPRTFFGRTFGSEKSAENVSNTIEPDTTATGNAQINEETVRKLTETIDTLTRELQVYKDKNEHLTDKYKRALADSENLRVRLTKQIADAKIFGIQGFCKDLLEVADTLGHATNAVPEAEVNDKNPHLKNLYEGLSMTKSSLLQVFKRHGLQPLNPLNEKFDPNYHEALFQKEDATKEPGTVVEVTKLGYKLQERCIRPALVGVSKSS